MPECSTLSCRRQVLTGRKLCESCLEAKRRWRQRNPEKQRQQRAGNKVRMDASKRAWDRRNPDALKAKRLRRRAREAAAACDEHLMTEYLPVIAVDPCAYCGASGGEVDHIVPLTKGGTNRWDNLVAACRSCNGSKRDHQLLEFMLCR